MKHLSGATRFKRESPVPRTYDFTLLPIFCPQCRKHNYEIHAHQFQLLPAEISSLDITLSVLMRTCLYLYPVGKFHYTYHKLIEDHLQKQVLLLAGESTNEYDSPSIVNIDAERQKIPTF